MNITLISSNFTIIDGFHLFLHSFISLFVMVDPMAAIPIFITLTHNYSDLQKQETLKQASVTTFCVLLFFAITGLRLLDIFGVSLAALRIAGGLLLLKVGFNQIQGKIDKIEKDEQKESLMKESIAIVPLTLPLLAGPGAISTVVMKAAALKDVVSYLIYFISIIMVVASAYFLLRSSQLIFKFFGKTGLNIFEKLMGILVAALAIQFILTGLHESFPGIL